jgi:hypothetical protein
MFFCSPLFSQLLIFGIDISKSYPNIISKKELTLKDQSLFCSYAIWSKGQQFCFSIDKADYIGIPDFNPNFKTRKNIKAGFLKGLNYLKSKLGSPLTIYSDSSFTSSTSMLNYEYHYFWKFKFNNDYYYFSYSTKHYTFSKFEDITLWVNKFNNEEDCDLNLKKYLLSLEILDGSFKSYIIKPDELKR